MITTLLPQTKLSALDANAKLICHMENTTRLEHRSIAIEKIPLNENYLKSKGFPHGNILKRSLEQICEIICETILPVPKNKIDNSMRPGILLGADIAGTRKNANIYDGNIKEEHIHPHIHGLIILPYELDEKQKEALINKITYKIQSLPITENNPKMKKRYRTVRITPYRPIKPIWWWIDYSLKLDFKNRSCDHGNSFVSLIYPYQLDMYKLKRSIENRKNKQFHKDKLNELIKREKHICDTMLLEPWNFFNDRIMTDISTKHYKHMEGHKKQNIPLMESPNKRRIMLELVRDGGAFLKKEEPFPSKVFTKKTPDEPEIIKFIDEVAIASILSDPEPLPSYELIQMVAMKNPFSRYLSFSDWAKSYDVYQERYLLAKKHLTKNAVA